MLLCMEIFKYFGPNIFIILSIFISLRLSFLDKYFLTQNSSTMLSLFLIILNILPNKIEISQNNRAFQFFYSFQNVNLSPKWKLSQNFFSQVMRLQSIIIKCPSGTLFELPYLIWSFPSSLL